MITITPSNLLRKYVGETSQLMKAVFSLSKKLSPCIIFIDEMDSMFRSRVEDDHPVLRNLQTECMLFYRYLTFLSNFLLYKNNKLWTRAHLI